MEQSTEQELPEQQTPVLTLIDITKQLTSILNDEMECLKTSRPSEIEQFQKRKNILTASYHKELNDIKLNGGLASAGSGEVVRNLKKESREFQKTLERHHAFVKAKKNLSERMIKEISMEISARNGTNSKYGSDAKMANHSLSSKTVTMAINQTI